MKMEVLAVQSTYGVLGSNKVRDWTSTLTPPSSSSSSSPSSVVVVGGVTTSAASAAVASGVAASASASSVTATTNKVLMKATKINNSNNNKSSINRNNSSSSSNNNKNNKKPKHQHTSYHTVVAPYTLYNAPLPISTTTTNTTTSSSNSSSSSSSTSNNRSSSSGGSSSNNNNSNNIPNNNFYCDEYDIDAAAVDELSLRLLDELRAAKSRHLTCTEVSLPCDLTPSIAAEIIRVSSKEPCGIRGCTIYIEFEDEPNNSRRIATLKLDPETVSTFEVYLTLRQDHRGWTALLPQFMKSLARTITISPEFTITKNKLYSTDCEGLSTRRSYSFGSNSSAAIATPST